MNIETNLEKPYKEPSQIRKKVERGEFAVEYYHGQTKLFIPKKVVDILGVEGIHVMAKQVFSEEVLNNFSVLAGNFELSYFMELPPQKSVENNQITKLIEMIKGQIAK